MELKPGLGLGSGAFGGGGLELERERNLEYRLKGEGLLGGDGRLRGEGLGEGDCSRKERRILFGFARPLTSMDTDGL